MSATAEVRCIDGEHWVFWMNQPFSSRACRSAAEAHEIAQWLNGLSGMERREFIGGRAA